MICPGSTDGICRAASEIAGADVRTHQLACDYCKANFHGQLRNRITFGLAAKHLGREGEDRIVAEHGSGVFLVSSGDDALRRVLSGAGVGSQLWRMLEEIQVRHSDSCDCLTWAEDMNRWGPDGCRARRADIIQHLRTARAELGWSAAIAAVVAAVPKTLSWRLRPLDPYGSLIDEAIRRAEAALVARPTLLAVPAADSIQPIDVLLPLGRGSKWHNIELRIALRSLLRHARGLRRVYVIGAIPDWLVETDQVCPVQRPEIDANKAARIAAKVTWAFEHLPVTDTIAFWNDDYLLVQDLDLQAIPDVYAGNLWRQDAVGWARLLQHTAEALQAAGMPCRHYDIHVPIRYERAKWLQLAAWWQRSEENRYGYVAKSVYGNFWCEATAQPGQDCKLSDGWQDRVERNCQERWVISYGNGAMRTGFGDWMKARFPDATAAERQPHRRQSPRRHRFGRPAKRPIVAVLGQFRGGTSAVAGVLHSLGVPMGRGWPRPQSNPRGTFEDRALARICRQAFREPALTQQLGPEEIMRRLALWARRRGHGRRRLIGAKHPSLCLCVPQIVAAWPNVRFVAVERPAAESAASIRSRMWRWSANQADTGTRRLIETRDRDLDTCGAPVLRIAYHDLLADPADAVDRLIQFCELSIDEQTRAQAIASVCPELRTIHGEADPVGGIGRQDRVADGLLPAA